MTGGGGGEAAQGSMAAITPTVGVAARMKGPLQRRDDRRAEGMMHHPIAKGSGADQTRRRLSGKKSTGGAELSTKFILPHKAD
jgi:hypothetical protein